MIIDTPTLGTTTYRKPLRKSMICVGAILVADDIADGKSQITRNFRENQVPPTHTSNKHQATRL